MHNPQLNANGELAHLLSIDGLPRSILTQILDTASSFLDDNPAEHRYGEKPYGVTPMMANPRGEVGVEVSLYTEAMIERLRERTTQRAGVRLGRHLAFFGERGAGVKNLNARIIDLTGEAGEVFEALAVVVGWRAIHPVAECRQDVNTLGRQDFLKERQRVHLPPSVGLVYR